MADLRTYPGGVIYAKPQCGGLSLTPEGLYMRNPSVADCRLPRRGYICETPVWRTVAYPGGVIYAKPQCGGACGASLGIWKLSSLHQPRRG
jgi:hypothetical protein